tara:strand:+ start:284 stop:415 length:132 start_codon:yes stop_codon:yes gene_type:complete
MGKRKQMSQINSEINGSNGLENVSKLTDVIHRLVTELRKLATI